MFSFIRGKDGETGKLKWPEDAEQVRNALAESLGAKNVAFLLGAGCSSLVVGDTEVGIPTMAPMAREFTAGGDDHSIFPTPSERAVLLEHFGVDIAAAPYSRNLERLMELLFSVRFCLASSSLQSHADMLGVVDTLVKKVRRFVWMKCTNGAFAHGNTRVLEMYESFYRKLVLRDRALPRPWVFTTNYDLFNETAMDRLGLPYANGFSGVIERRFNPATYRYALAEQLDLTTRKWTAVDGFVYLCKLHGSVSWIEDGHGLFPIRETAKPQDPGSVMIYPTPAKQNAALSSPYSDMLREFQSRVVREQGVLFTVGYAFGDEHINNIIYQALTIPTFRLVIFADPSLPGELQKLRGLGDPRVWIVGGDGPKEGSKAHFFATMVEEFMPQRPSERIGQAIERVLSALAKTKVTEE